MMLFNYFIPHAHCYLWRPDLILLHGISDSLISIAYFSIPLLLIYFIRQRQDVPFRKIFVLFSAFIVSCGFTHTLEVWTLWVPAYWVSGGMKMVTATVSIYTAFSLIPIIPQALALPSPRELALLNQTLSDEIQERKQAEGKINTLNEQLQEKISDLEQLAILKDEFMST
ncbi:MAG: hybrid sensor histidine kinase/response regulator, partial [Synechococcaceae cyanobacterium RM1_1_27]|nr:hybrid sensor histidine kinase/response regulator [Synechococcaceae cyanobacterium RM1_1_27]